MADDKVPHDRFVHEYLDQVDVIDEDGKPVSLEELMKRKRCESEDRSDATSEDAERCIETVEQFIPIQQYSGQYQEICSKLLLTADDAKRIDDAHNYVADKLKRSR